MKRRGQLSPKEDAFTIVELLVVLVIIGIMSAIAIPAIRGIGQSNTMSSATRQLLDDLALARHKAIVGRTIVHVLFLPPAAAQQDPVYDGGTPDPRTLDHRNRLKGGGLTTYALYAERTVGDQPGRRMDRYLTGWRTLPEGVFIHPSEFEDLQTVDWVAASALGAPFAREDLPFPTVAGIAVRMPHIAFEYNGSLLQLDQNKQRIFKDEYIWLTKGSVFVQRDANGYAIPPLDVRESPPGNWMTNYNRIHIDAISGRAKVERPEIQ